MLKLGVHKTFKGKRLYKEVWKPIIKGQRGKYEISNRGRVKSLNFNGGKEEGFLKLQRDTKGYYYIMFCINKKPTTFRVHRLVAEAFIPNTNNKPFIDHINTIKTDNRVQNLRWATHKENANNELTLKHNSEVRKGKKLSEEHKKKIRDGSTACKKILCVETGVIYKSIREAERQTNISRSSIGEVCSGKRKSAGGYHWKYVKSN
jgi:hypothetical protein